MPSATSRTWPVSPEDYGTNLKTIITKLHSTYPDALFVVNYPIWYSPNTHNGAVYMEAGLNRLKSYHPIVDQMVAELQAQGIAIWTGSKEAFGFFEDKPEYFIAENGYDGTFYLHPNATGAEHLGHFWAESIIKNISILRIRMAISLSAISIPASISPPKAAPPALCP